MTSSSICEYFEKTTGSYVILFYPLVHFLQLYHRILLRHHRTRPVPKIKRSFLSEKVNFVNVPVYQLQLNWSSKSPLVRQSASYFRE